MPWWAQLAMQLIQLLIPIVQSIINKPTASRSNAVAAFGDHVRSGIDRVF